MVKEPELIEAPLSAEQLALLYRALIENPCYANLQGKIEVDVWGRLFMSPANNHHGAVRAALSGKLATLGGSAFVGASIITAAGVLVADVAWASDGFMLAHKFETPYTRAPEICVEVVSPSNSVMELEEKRAAYHLAGAEEFWIVFPQSKRCEVYGKQGLIQRSAYTVDLAGVFDPA